MPPSKVIRFGTFEADLRARELRRKGQLIPLQDKPFAVLATLLERPGDLLTREELQARLWEPGTHVELEDGLNTAVSKLRQALRDGADSPRFIETLPKRGYRFIAPCSAEVTSSFMTPARGLAAVVLIPAAVAGWLLYSAPATEETAAEAADVALLAEVSPHSVAVLPFENRGAGEDDAYFAAGVTEELVDRLTKIDRLTVIGRRSTRAYADTDLRVRQVARELHVATVLEGSVRREGEQVRISAQLIDGETERSLWSETYQRRLDDLFSVETEVAQRIVEALEVELSVEERADLSVVPATNFTAYDLYLRGLESYRRFTRDDNEAAIAFFEQTLAEDPNFGLGRAGLADAYYARAMRYDFPRREWLEASLEQARLAVAADAELPEAHKSLGVALAGQGLYEESLAAFLRAIDIRPGYVMAINNVGAAYEQMGHLDEALVWFRRAVELNPVDPFFYVNIGGLYAVLGADDAAFKWLGRALELEPGSVHARVWLGALHVYRGEPNQLLGLAEEILASTPDDPTGQSLAGAAYWLLDDRAAAEEHLRSALHDGFVTRNEIVLGHVLWTSGRREEAEPLLAGALEDLAARIDEGSRSSGHYVQLAQIHAIREELEEALDALERAAELEYPYVRFLRRDPSLASLAAEPRFQAITGRIASKLDAMRARVDDS